MKLRTPSSWLTDAEGINYPPSPWRLGGTGHMSIWQIPIKDLPIVFPAGVEPVIRFGRATVVTGWVTYTPGSVLEYNELILIVQVKANHRRLGSITHAWVDSPASVAGGRALWGIPKQLGAFELSDSTIFEASATANGQAIASFQFRPGFTLPGWWRISLPTAQWSESGAIQVTEGHLLARVQLGSGDWTIAAEGPLAFLSGHKPLLNLRFAQMAFSFGI